MRVSYCDDYFVPLPPRHPFPMGKFPALHRLLLAEGVIRAEDVVAPREADWSDLLLVHTRAYLDKLARGAQSRHEERRTGLPWSPALVKRSRVAVQGTINAALMALTEGIAGNLAGGTHHAMPDWGEGFCVLNDVAVAIRVLERSRWIRRALVIDLDVHQGNGTAALFEGDDSVFTFSIHGEHNFPFRKQRSCRDVGLPDGTGDSAYLDVLATHLPEVLEASGADLLFYQAGVDPLAEDGLGRLSLTHAGMRERDRLVLEAAWHRGLPLVLTLGGGYAKPITATLEAHVGTYETALTVFR